jgi:hypothetical protein
VCVSLVYDIGLLEMKDSYQARWRIFYILVFILSRIRGVTIDGVRMIEWMY